MKKGEKLNNYIQELSKVFLSLSTEKEVTEFLKDILTHQELESVSKRLQIIKLLKSGITQNEIVEILGAGIATVTRGSTLLKEGHFAYIKQSKQLSTN